MEEEKPVGIKEKTQLFILSMPNASAGCFTRMIDHLRPAIVRLEKEGIEIVLCTDKIVPASLEAYAGFLESMLAKAKKMIEDSKKIPEPIAPPDSKALEAIGKKAEAEAQAIERESRRR